MELQRQVSGYFTDVTRHANVALKAQTSPDVVSHMYRIVGHLVKYCAKLLYVRVRRWFVSKVTLISYISL